MTVRYGQAFRHSGERDAPLRSHAPGSWKPTEWRDGRLRENFSQAPTAG
ncbi:hypothetical protein M2271_006608 [Streptomyces sp. LBL]|nr:hypothetical protein [Streptomyces sp. LBL]MDH6628773.1 hypothetical protein [Streptomyces sp. LBL]